MSLAQQAPETSANALPSRDTSLLTHWGLLLAVLPLIAIMLLPTPAGLPVAGHRMLAVLAFAVIVWMTEALDYAVSAVVIAALMAFLLGLSPNPANPKALDGHQRRSRARLQRVRQHGARAGRLRAVSRRRHDGDRPR